MRRLDLRGRIMLAVGAGGLAAAACGGRESASEGRPGADAASDATSGATEGGREAQGGGGASADDAASDARAGSGGTSAATEGGVGDAASDALSYDLVDATADDVGADVAPDACAQYGQACTQSSECCYGVPCNAGAPCNQPSGCICYISVRRPFLVGSSLRVATAVERIDWQSENWALGPPVDLDPATAEALGYDWLRDACEEHASIAAFARFTMHLVSVGAPPEMIVASQSAAIDEVRHARACFALARRYSGRTMGPAALSLDGAMAPMTLAEIAALTAEEGCVGETLGVLLAEEQFLRTTDLLVRSLLVRANIVADEGRHAELAWSFVGWAVAQGGAPVRRAVAAAIRRAIDNTLAMPIRSYDAIDVEAWRAHGRLTCAEVHAVVERGVREIVEPCAAVLLGVPLPKAVIRESTMASCACPDPSAPAVG